MSHNSPTRMTGHPISTCKNHLEITRQGFEERDQAFPSKYPTKTSLYHNTQPVNHKTNSNTNRLSHFPNKISEGQKGGKGRNRCPEVHNRRNEGAGWSALILTHTEVSLWMPPLPSHPPPPPPPLLPSSLLLHNLLSKTQYQFWLKRQQDDVKIKTWR